MKYYFKCPNCGSNERFAKPSEQPSSTGCLLLFFGGIISALLFANYRWRRVQCLKCMHIFRQPSLPGTPLSHFATWIGYLTVMTVVAGVVGFAAPELAAALPRVPVISAIKQALVAQPRAMAYVIVTLVSLILISCLLAGAWSKVTFRRELLTKYQLRPLSAADLAKPSNPEWQGNIQTGKGQNADAAAFNEPMTFRFLRRDHLDVARP